MRVLLSTSGTRGDIEPALGLALRLRELGAQVRVCAPPDFERRFTELGVPLVPLGPPMPGSHGTKASLADRLDYADQWPAVQFDTISTAAAGCDAVIATGITEIAARSVAEKLGIHYQYASYQPTSLPSPHHPPMPRMPGDRPAPAAIGNELQWEIDAQGWNAEFGEALDTRRAALGLPPVGSVRDHVITDRPWLAADPVLGPWPESPGLDVVQTGAWIVPDERPLPAELEAFLDAGTPPVYIGFGSMLVHNGIARVAIEAIRAHNRRALLARGWAELAVIDDLPDCMAVGEVNHQALFTRVAAVIHHGGAGTTTTAARAGVPQVVVPQMMDQSYWARRVVGLGIGTACEDVGPDIASLSAALDMALTSTTRARASVVASMIRADGATVAAKLLIDAIS
ncbi:glycosyltransferase [Nocardia sp. NBC_01009]|uniref:glycosyltransferase n=1 Tax=Nocardia sp. NBC_01009 TaxID=2975996 RepID=UPI0038632EEC|nr:glycosyltransferase [Nocardia sp. NBC_01009]